jgi:cell division protease FtsH
MFTSNAESLITIAKNIAEAGKSSTLELEHFYAGMVFSQEARIRLKQLIEVPESSIEEVQKLNPGPFVGKKPLSRDVEAYIQQARDLSDQVPDAVHPGLIDLKHLIGALAASQKFANKYKFSVVPLEDVIRRISLWNEEETESGNIFELTSRLEIMKSSLMHKIYGQDHAVQAFIEGIFNSEVVAPVDHDRRGPRAIFVFAGPPGVGKTFLAEQGAALLNRPFKRFDMNAYSHPVQADELVGTPKMYNQARPGALTNFVLQNPESVLLFDEIEKAHLRTIHFFLQILDAGTLEDKFHEKTANFRDTVIIFTTNATHQLYENRSGNRQVKYHRKTILNALETDIDPMTNNPYFPAAICSRMGKGYPVLFNHLSINELEMVARAEIRRNLNLLETRYLKSFEVDEVVVHSLVLREGGGADARTINAQTQLFIRSEILKICQLFKSENLEKVFTNVNQIHFTLDKEINKYDEDIQALYESKEKPKILLLADEYIANLYKDKIPDIEFVCHSVEDALFVLSENVVDFVILDLFLSGEKITHVETISSFPKIPFAAKRLQLAQTFLAEMNRRLLNVPTFLLSIDSDAPEAANRRTVDDELLLYFAEKWNIRGRLDSDLINARKGCEQFADEFSKKLNDTYYVIYQERLAEKLGQQQRVLSFESSQKYNKEKKKITVELRNLRLERALHASDVDQLVSEVERPQITFKDVVGADDAKKELQFFIDFLKNSRRYCAMGLRPPKGVLLYGPPGTGKTLLAKAMAGESNVAFISASASNFVTIWQGSGPQSVRDLFTRARRYAPSIIFIDEIDAIGKVRTGGAGGQQSYETTLNALLAEMDGFVSPSADRPVFIMAATNFDIEPRGDSSRLLDPALVRRFSRTILIDTPSMDARKAYLESHLDNKMFEVSKNIIKVLAERSSGMSIANLEQIIESATRTAVEQNTKITDAVLEEAFEKISFGERKFWDEATRERTAYHEAGHVILYWCAGWLPTYVTIVSRGHFGGYMARDPKEVEEKFGYTKEELLANTRVSLGGRMAEILHYGNQNGLTTGASDDLRKATSVIRDMICRYGMDDDIGPLVLENVIRDPGQAPPEISQKITEILKEQAQETLSLLTSHQAKLDAIAKALQKEERLTKADVDNILNK